MRLHKSADSLELSLLVLAIKTLQIVCLCLHNIHVHVYSFGDPTLLIFYNSRFTLMSQTIGNKHCRYKES